MGIKKNQKVVPEMSGIHVVTQPVPKVKVPKRIRRRGQQPKLWRRGAGIGKRAVWAPHLERYVIGKVN